MLPLSLDLVGVRRSLGVLFRPNNCARCSFGLGSRRLQRVASERARRHVDQ
jgi:hypothetical protein